MRIHALQCCEDARFRLLGDGTLPFPLSPTGRFSRHAKFVQRWLPPDPALDLRSRPQGPGFDQFVQFGPAPTPSDIITRDRKVGIGATQNVCADRLTVATDEDHNSIRRRHHWPAERRQIIGVERIASPTTFCRAGPSGRLFVGPPILDSALPALIGLVTVDDKEYGHGMVRRNCRISTQPAFWSNGSGPEQQAPHGLALRKTVVAVVCRQVRIPVSDMSIREAVLFACIMRSYMAMLHAGDDLPSADF